MPCEKTPTAVAGLALKASWAAVPEHGTLTGHVLLLAQRRSRGQARGGDQEQCHGT
jgi:hypothetical protein